MRPGPGWARHATTIRRLYSAVVATPGAHHGSPGARRTHHRRASMRPRGIAPDGTPTQPPTSSEGIPKELRRYSRSKFRSLPGRPQKAADLQPSVSPRSNLDGQEVEDHLSVAPRYQSSPRPCSRACRAGVREHETARQPRDARRRHDAPRPRSRDFGGRAEDVARAASRHGPIQRRRSTPSACGRRDTGTPRAFGRGARFRDDCERYYAPLLREREQSRRAVRHPEGTAAAASTWILERARYASCVRRSSSSTSSGAEGPRRLLRAQLEEVLSTSVQSLKRLRGQAHDPRLPHESEREAILRTLSTLPRAARAVARAAMLVYMDNWQSVARRPPRHEPPSIERDARPAGRCRRGSSSARARTRHRRPSPR